MGKSIFFNAFYPLKFLFLFTFWQKKSYRNHRYLHCFAKKYVSASYPPCSILRKSAFEGAPVFSGLPCRDSDTPTGSESVLRIGIFVPCLVIMAGFTKALPVVFVPEQNGVTTVRSDMIDYRCFHCLSFFITLHTERMQTKVSLPCFLPSASVPTLPAAHPIASVLCFMLLTIVSVRQLRAAGMMAGFLWFHWHCQHLPSM